VSEYQYFEFLAIDRPLSEKEMDILRSYSTRARITPTSFVNHYNWGNFKGDEDDWMERYFDAFVYVANWGTHVFKLRLPSKLPIVSMARQYCLTDAFFMSEKQDVTVITFESEDEDGDWEEGEGWLSSLIPIRTELARGDMRALYIGWLHCVRHFGVGDDEMEPPVPPNLRNLSGPLKSLVHFLRIDEDLLAVAAEVSPNIKVEPRNREDVASWIAELPVSEKDEMLVRLMEGEDVHLSSNLVSRFEQERHGPNLGDDGVHLPKRRTVAELLDTAEKYAEERHRIAAKKAAEAKARRKHEAAIARERHLDSLAGTELQMWTEIERFIVITQPKAYDLAVLMLIDLRDLEARKTGEGDFQSRLDALRNTHARKSSLIRRLKEAGL